MSERPIILISPPTSNSIGKTGGLGGAEHLGLGYLSSYLEMYNYRTEIYNYEENFVTVDEAASEVIGKAPILIGISPTSYSIEWTLRFCKNVKSISNIHLILGGHLATFHYEKLLLDCASIDVICLGDGEQTLLKLVEYNITNNIKLDEIENISYRTLDNKIVTTNRSYKTEDLNILPWPKRNKIIGKKGSARILMSRGCPFNCDFCTTPNFYQQNVRYRNVNDVVSEMIILNKTYGIKRFYFSDDLFLTSSSISKQRINDFCNLLRANLPKIEFRCELRADIIMNNINIIKDLYSVGMKYAFVGIESFLDSDLALYGKHTHSQTMQLFPSILRNIGISVVPGFIIFNQNTTLKDLVKNAEQLLSHSYLYRIASISRTCIGYPGSRLYNEMLENKNFDLERSNNYLLYPKFNSEKVRILSIAMEQVEFLYKDVDSRMLLLVNNVYDEYILRAKNNLNDSMILNASTILQGIQKEYFTLFCKAIDITNEISNHSNSTILNLFKHRLEYIKLEVDNFENALYNALK